MIYRVGDVVELAQGASLGLSGSVARGAKGVVLREPGLMSKGYLVRLDAAGRQVELPAEALRRSGDVWSSGPVVKTSPSSQPPWWQHRSEAEPQTPPGRARASATTPPASPASPAVTATTTWRGAGDVGRRPNLGAVGETRATSATRRSPAEAVDELKRRLGSRRRRRGGGDEAGGSTTR